MSLAIEGQEYASVSPPSCTWPNAQVCFHPPLLLGSLEGKVENPGDPDVIQTWAVGQLGGQGQSLPPPPLTPWVALRKEVTHVAPVPLSP